MSGYGVCREVPDLPRLMLPLEFGPVWGPRHKHAPSFGIRRRATATGPIAAGALAAKFALVQ